MFLEYSMWICAIYANTCTSAVEITLHLACAGLYSEYFELKQSHKLLCLSGFVQLVITLNKLGWISICFIAVHFYSPLFALMTSSGNYFQSASFASPTRKLQRSNS